MKIILNIGKIIQKIEFNQNPFPITEERKKVEVIRYFKPYKIPSQKSYD